MSADLLREAAAQMRERAEAATPGPWFTNAGVKQVEVVSGEDDLIYRRVRDTQAPRDAHHIASWHPAVAFAVADWLYAEADEIPPHATHYRDGLLDDAPAVRVARAYLNRPSP